MKPRLYGTSGHYGLWLLLLLPKLIPPLKWCRPDTIASQFEHGSGSRNDGTNPYLSCLFQHIKAAEFVPVPIQIIDENPRAQYF